MTKKGNVVTLIFVTAALVGILTWFGINPNSLSTLFSGSTPISNCNVSAIPKQPQGLIFYSQGEVFCIPKGQTIAINFSVPDNLGYGVGMVINGSYTASADTEFYILNSVQYGQFVVLKDKSSNYTWYSGNNKGAIINSNILPTGSYYLVFYTKSSNDTISILRSIQAGYRVNYG